MPMRLVTIGAGQERAGCTLLAAGLGIAMARSGANVVLIDLDLRAADLHLVLGTPHPRHGVSDFLARRAPGLGQLAVPVPGHERLRFVPGVLETVRPSALSDEETGRIVAAMLEVDADFVVADLPPGVSAAALDLLLAGDLGLIVARASREGARAAARLARLARVRRSARAPGGESPRNTRRPRVYTSIDDLVRDMNTLREESARRPRAASRQALVINRLPDRAPEIARAELVTQLSEEEGPAAELPILGTLPDVPDLESTLPAVFDGFDGGTPLGRAIEVLARRIGAELPPGDDGGSAHSALHEALLV